MKTIIYILTLALFVSTCKQTKSTSGKKTIETKEITTEPTEIPQSIKKSTKLDSIDKANNESVVASGDNITKAFVSLKNSDSTIHLGANIRQDHRIFGYAKPDINSEKLFLLSIFTNDVENNPFGCKLGAYYDTGGMENLTLKYKSTTGNFVKAIATDNANNPTTIYFEKKWIELE